MADKDKEAQKTEAREFFKGIVKEAITEVRNEENSARTKTGDNNQNNQNNQNDQNNQNNQNENKPFLARIIDEFFS